MIRSAWLLILVPVITVAQPSDSDTLQAILQELKHLREEIPATNLVAQRVQILLYRARVQEDVVSKAKQRADQATAKLKDAEQARGRTAADLKQIEEKLEATQDRAEHARLEEITRELKRRMEMWVEDETRLRATEVTVTSDLRMEEAKLVDLQQRLDKMERQLEIYNSDRTAK